MVGKGPTAISHNSRMLPRTSLLQVNGFRHGFGELRQWNDIQIFYIITITINNEFSVRNVRLLCIFRHNTFFK